MTNVLSLATHKILEGMRKAQRTPMHHMSASEAKAYYAKAAHVLELPLSALAPLARIEDKTIQVSDGAALPIRLYAPSNEVLPVLLFFHGGGFVVGSIDSHDALCRDLAAQSGCAVLSLDYRLAPEFRFPQAVNDAWDTLCQLVRCADFFAKSWHIDSRRPALGGDSAGGTLAAVCAHMARDAGLALSLQALLYPGVSDWQQSASHQRFAQGHLLESAQVQWFFSHYVEDAERSDWRFAPLLAPDFEGLCPAWIGLAECDPLVDEGLEYADRLRMAGVEVELELYRGVVHEFIKMPLAVPEARQARSAMAAALRRALFQSDEESLFAYLG